MAGKEERSGPLPDWVPRGARHYIAHVEAGTPIRELARGAGCHASTVLRQIRRFETRRDDPLVDAALRHLGRGRGRRDAPRGLPDGAELARQAPRLLGRLCEPGALLVVAAEMEKALVVREAEAGVPTQTAIVPAPLAQALALKDWISPTRRGRLTRYEITAAGRSALEAMLARGAVGTLPAPEVLPAPPPTELASPRKQRMRHALSESPMVTLSRRRDGRGRPFLSAAMVRAGEQLREDFELAQMDGKAPAWEGAEATPEGGRGAAAARSRVARALSHLGPGLSDVALRCCCYLEGLEVTERRLGWSARSGKVVLRIALGRLQRHYEETIGLEGPMIG